MNSNTNQPTETTAPEKQTGVGFVSLLQIIQNLISLGLNSVELWRTVIHKLKSDPDFSAQPEHLNLHLLLTEISNHFWSKVHDFFPTELSQHKLPLMLAAQISYNDLIKAVKPLLRKKKFSDKTFSTECCNALYCAVEDFLTELKDGDHFSGDDDVEETDCTEIPTTSNCVKPNEVDRVKSKKSKTLKRKRSPSPSGSSAASNGGSEHSSDSDHESDSDDGMEKFQKLFKSTKKGPVKIKQVFQTQKKRLRRKLTTPGEQGRYMIKIELTDTRDLKKVKASQYWTKVSTKAVFLAEPKSSIYKNLSNILFSVGSSIKSTRGVECDEMKIDKKSKY